MKILIADDDAVTRCVLETKLREWGHEVEQAVNGQEALAALQQKDPPALAILDWIMPGVEGLEVCRQVRHWQQEQPPYLILLTVKGERADVITGLTGGADDYLAKPFDWGELRARVQVGVRILQLQHKLGE